MAVRRMEKSSIDSPGETELLELAAACLRLSLPHALAPEAHGLDRLPRRLSQSLTGSVRTSSGGRARSSAANAARSSRLSSPSHTSTRYVFRVRGTFQSAPKSFNLRYFD
jgi:hypothetical protein